MSVFVPDTTIQSAPREPIAIIGLGCRFPGRAHDWQSYWNLLETGQDAIIETPAERWNLQKFYAPGATMPGKTQSKWGGYVEGIDQFDPELFGISPREAASMDPQQRLLLETSFRAIEDAGKRVDQIAGQPIAVYIGISSFDYAVAGLSPKDRGVIDAYSNTGGSSSIAANRISYCFDLRGPSMAVDTACSSSLVAVHLACQSLWRGESNMALAGGVNALILPDFYVAFSQLGVMSPDGRCRTFDAQANGYVRSEGAGVVLLKPLRAALRDKDPVYAVIRGSAVNQDGRTPGMTVPSQMAQETLIRTACQQAGVSPRDLQYVEAHGTGTPTGDPIEARAIGEVVGTGRTPEEQCWVGSVKTNIGHLEAGAGAASLIKVALALHHRRIPPNLHFEIANPAIDLNSLGLRIPTTIQEWQSNRVRLAGINGFGYGGTNAHLIVEQAPEIVRNIFSTASSHRTPEEKAHRRNPETEKLTSDQLNKSLAATPVLIPLSARSKTALQNSADQLALWLGGEGRNYHLAEVAGYLAHRRSHLDSRTAVCACDHDEMIDKLGTLSTALKNEIGSGITASQLALGPAFVCSGQGPQWWGMGRGLLKYSPAFRSAIKRCEAEFAKYASWSLVDELEKSEENSRMHETCIAQPSIFAIQVALGALWESWGVRPTAVVGHSVGEIAAAYLTGALSWEDACLVAFHRGRTMDLASSQGGMVAVGLSVDEAPKWLEGLDEEVSIAAINGPTNMTISGAALAIDQLADRLESNGIFCRRLEVEYAFHSPQMEPVRAELLNSLESIRPRATHSTMISTVTGRAVTGRELGAEYWWRNVRQSVRFAEAMTRLAESGYGIAVEIGPHPVLAYAINECFQASGKSVRSVPSLSRQQNDLLCISKSLGTLYSLGIEIDWGGFYNQPTRKLSLPTYPMQTQRLWTESLESHTMRKAPEAHALLGQSTDQSVLVWQQRIDLKVQGYLADHRVRGTIIYPAAAILETALAAAVQIATQQQTVDATDSTRGASPTVRLEHMRLHHPIILTDDQPVWIETEFNAERRQLALAFRGCKPPAFDEIALAQTWTKLATVDLIASAGAVHETDDMYARIQHAKQQCNEPFSQTQLYDYCASLGLQYGEQFHGTLRGVRRAGEAVTEVALPPSIDGTGYRLHPSLLDSCFHAIIAADSPFDSKLEGLYLPAEIGGVTLYGAMNTQEPVRRVLVHARVLKKNSKRMWCDIDVVSMDGQPIVSIRGFESHRVASPSTVGTTEDLIYGFRWQLADHQASQPESSDRQWIVFMDEGQFGKELSSQLRQRGDRVDEVYQADSHVPQANVPQSSRGGFHQVHPESREDFDTLFARLSAKWDAALVSDETKIGIIYLWGLDAPESHTLDSQSLRASTLLTSLAPLYLSQAWSSNEHLPAADLVFVTRGAQPNDVTSQAKQTIQVAQGPLVGFGRVVINEVAKLRAKLVDLPSLRSLADTDHVIAELAIKDDEDEIRWRDGQRWVPRFVELRDEPLNAEARRQLPLRLSSGRSSGIEQLRHETMRVEELAAGEVEIEVYASGLNFSDVMKSLDLYPGLTEPKVPLGAECSGRIVRVGIGSHWKVGDEVMAVAPGAFASHVVVHQGLVARKPNNLTHEQAASIPIAFLTAEYAMHSCARLQQGDSILIHAASGGVGLAAIQLATAAGLRVLATAGSEEKRDFVRKLGVEHVMDSRSLAFGQQTLDATHGQGVDAILNSLPGEAIPTGLKILKTGGRFLEIGKRDIYGDASLGLYPFRKNLALFAIDLDQLFKEQPARMGKMLQGLAERFERGELQPLPKTEFSADEVASAFRLMQQGKHIGKIVVTYQPKPSHVVAGALSELKFRPDATYWIAGGLGGFGLEIVKWIVSRGARHVILSGRSRSVPSKVQSALDELALTGASITVLPVDITQATEVARALRVIDQNYPQLAGVFHTAMVLEDRLIADLDRQTLERVLWPKVLGGWNLHEHTLDRTLDMFVLFSSLSSVFGHAGQANYSASNALLDSLAHYRRSFGKPGLVINWGHLGEVGYLAQREQLGQRLERQGVMSFSVRQATHCLEYALQTKAIQLSVLRMDWTVWRGLGITGRVSPKFAHLLRSTEASSQSAGDTVDAAQLRAMTDADRVQMVGELLRTKVARLLGMTVTQVREDRAPLEMGLDSLMAVELRNWIESVLEINLQISALMRSRSLGEIAQHLSDLIGQASENQTHSTSGPGRTDQGHNVPLHRASEDSVSGKLAAKVDEMPSSKLSGKQAAELLEDLDHLTDDDVSELLSKLLKE